MHTICFAIKCYWNYGLLQQHESCTKWLRLGFNRGHCPCKSGFQWCLSPWMSTGAWVHLQMLWFTCLPAVQVREFSFKMSLRCLFGSPAWDLLSPCLSCLRRSCGGPCVVSTQSSYLLSQKGRGAPGKREFSSLAAAEGAWMNWIHCGMARSDEMNATPCQKAITHLVIPLELMERMMHMLSKGKIIQCSHPSLIFCSTSISILSLENGRRIREASTEWLQASQKWGKEKEQSINTKVFFYSLNAF